MKTYEVTIQPQSAFATPLKGDTLFGHFCWQAASQPDLINGGLEAALETYRQQPFAVFSSAFPKLKNEEGRYVLRRPEVPLHWLLGARDQSRETRFERLKEFKNKKWMVVPGTLVIDVKTCRFIDDEELFEKAVSATPPNVRDQLAKDGGHAFHASFSQAHNTINRLSATTGSGPFAPYSVDCEYFVPGTMLAVFVVIDDVFTDIERVVKALTGIGRFGFGRDASTGKGRFEVLRWKQIEIPDFTADSACYTLAPCVPAPGALKRAFFTPFVRFGKHGDHLAISKNPFKNPVVMADEGAVFAIPGQSTPFNAYIGSAVGGVSKVQKSTVVQGYAPCLPIKLEISNESR